MPYLVANLTGGTVCCTEKVSHGTGNSFRILMAPLVGISRRLRSGHRYVDLPRARTAHDGVHPPLGIDAKEVSGAFSL